MFTNRKNLNKERFPLRVEFDSGKESKELKLGTKKTGWTIKTFLFCRLDLNLKERVKKDFKDFLLIATRRWNPTSQIKS